MLYICSIQAVRMITSIQHKGLKLLWTKGDRSKLPAAMLARIERVLTVIDALAVVPDDLLDLPFLRPHPLKGDLQGFWSISVSGNWRIIFRFDNASHSAYDLDFIDYH